MEQLKFRAWNKELSRMFMVPSREWSLSLHDTGNMILMWCSDGIVDEIPVDEVMQFAGMRDVVGADIYEGDQVQYTATAPGGHDFIGVVKFYDGAFWIDNGRKAISCFSETGELSLTGENVHQNPELMESK